ncbi:MAG: hypothetical protein H8E59_01895 [Actinobacteria bacterium]|nr:hypothetical protein [Actinomycetota bacterium]
MQANNRSMGMEALRGWPRVFVLVVVIGFAAAGCGSGVELATADDPVVPKTKVTVATTISPTPVVEAPSGERQRFEQMWAVAMADEEIVYGEFWVFASEAAACARRGGIDASVAASGFENLDLVVGFGGLGESDSSADPGRVVEFGIEGEALLEACSWTFHWPAQADFGRWDPVYGERFPLDETVWAQGEAAFLACLEAEGSGTALGGYDDAMEKVMAGQGLPPELAHYCFIMAFVD